MPVFRLRIFSLLFCLVTSGLFGQDDKPTYYCQSCCSGVNEYYLMFTNDGKFECYYLTKQAKKTVSFFGMGKFAEANENVTLTFDEIPPDGIDVEKIGDNNLVIINFRIERNVQRDSLSANVDFARAVNKSFFCNRQECMIKTRFIPNEKITFSSIGFKSLTYTLPKPGEYRLRVRLNPEGDVYFKKGEQKLLQKRNSKYGPEFEDSENRKICFTNKSCRR